MSLTRARELAVLSVVLAHPAHGYDIAAHLSQGPFALLGLQKSAVYAILSRFAKRGWIEEKEERSEGYPDRLVCHPTEAGRQALAGLIAEAGGLSSTPLLGLAMLVDSGQDVSDALRAEIGRRKTLREAITADRAHRDSATVQVALALLDAELNALRRLLKQTP